VYSSDPNSILCTDWYVLVAEFDLTGALQTRLSPFDFEFSERGQNLGLIDIIIDLTPPLSSRMRLGTSTTQMACHTILRLACDFP